MILFYWIHCKVYVIKRVKILIFKFKVLVYA